MLHTGTNDGPYSQKHYIQSGKGFLEVRTRRLSSLQNGKVGLRGESFVTQFMKSIGSECAHFKEIRRKYYFKILGMRKVQTCRMSSVCIVVIYSEPDKVYCQLQTNVKFEG